MLWAGTLVDLSYEYSRAPYSSERHRLRDAAGYARLCVSRRSDRSPTSACAVCARYLKPATHHPRRITSFCISRGFVRRRVNLVVWPMQTMAWPPKQRQCWVSRSQPEERPGRSKSNDQLDPRSVHKCCQISSHFDRPRWSSLRKLVPLLSARHRKSSLGKLLDGRIGFHEQGLQGGHLYIRHANRSHASKRSQPSDCGREANVLRCHPPSSLFSSSTSHCKGTCARRSL